MTKEINRHLLLAAATRMFCCECGTVRTVSDYFATAKSQRIALVCGHRRDREIQEIGHEQTRESSEG